jgi:hypothetical protein
VGSIFGYDGYIYLRNVYTAFFPKRTQSLEVPTLAETLSTLDEPLTPLSDKILEIYATPISSLLEPDNSIHTT